MKKATFDSFGDGVAIIKKEIKAKVDISSDKKKQEYLPMGKIRFDIVIQRQQDAEFIESKGRTLSLKIKVPRSSFISNDLTVFIKDDCFHIVEMDEDKKNNRMFIYLEKAVI